MSCCATAERGRLNRPRHRPAEAVDGRTGPRAVANGADSRCGKPGDNAWKTEKTPPFGPKKTVDSKHGCLRVEKDIKTGLDKFRIVGSDADGRKLEVVVNLDESGLGRVTIITAFDSKVTATTGRQGKVN